MVRLYVSLGSPTKAQAYLNKLHNFATLAIQAKSDSPRFKMYIAEAEVEMGNFNVAAIKLREFIDDEENNNREPTTTLTNAHALLGRIETLNKHYDVAHKELTHAFNMIQATQIKQDKAFVLLNLALLKEAMGNLKEALSHANEALVFYKQLGMKIRITEVEEIIARCKEN